LSPNGKGGENRGSGIRGVRSPTFQARFSVAKWQGSAHQGVEGKSDMSAGVPLWAAMWISKTYAIVVNRKERLMMRKRAVGVKSVEKKVEKEKKRHGRVLSTNPLGASVWERILRESTYQRE